VKRKLSKRDGNKGLITLQSNNPNGEEALLKELNKMGVVKS